MIEPWDVIWPYDPDAKPPKPKLWVAVAPSRGWFLRINSAHRRGSVRLQSADHPFLAHDSWLHCWGPPIEKDDYELARLMQRQQRPDKKGIVGTVAHSVRDEVRREVSRSPVLTPRQIRLIERALR